jgi:Sap, sulfolipid-1-addressing protein
MFAALGHLLPIALAVALSSVPITATLLILLSPKRNRSAIPFLIGWVLGMAVVLAVFGYGGNALPIIPTRAQSTSIGTAEIIVGATLVVLAVVSWLRARNSPPKETNRWLQAIGSFGPLPSFGVAFALNFRPKGLLLGAAAGLALAGDTLTTTAAVIAGVYYVVIASSTVAGPIVVTLAAPERMQPRLIAARDWLEDNSRTMASLIMLMIGVVIIGVGLSRI